MNRMIVLFGSNIEPELSLKAAVQALQNRNDLGISAMSHVYESPAVGVDGDTDLSRTPYHNAAFLIRTHMHVPQLREALRWIEKSLGRQRVTDKFADRKVDLDIIGYFTGDCFVATDQAVLTQAYAAVPAAEIAPDWKLPQTGATLEEVAKGCPAENITTLRRIE